MLKRRNKGLMKTIEITADSNRNLICGEYRVFAGEQYNCAFLIDDRFSGDDTPDYYILNFETVPFGRKFSSGRISRESSPARVTDGGIYCPLTKEMTRTGRLRIQLEAHSFDGDDNEVIEKTGIATLDFGCSLEPGGEAGGADVSLSADVERIERRVTALENMPSPEPGWLSVVCAAKLLYIDGMQTPLIFASGRDEAESILTEMIDAFDYENCRFIMAAVPKEGMSEACLITVRAGSGGFDMRRYSGRELLDLLKEDD